CDAQDEKGEKADKRDGDGDHRRDARRTKCLGELKQTLHRPSSPARKTFRAAHSARFAQFMVSAGLIAAGDGGENRGGANPQRRRANAMTASGARRAEKNKTPAAAAAGVDRLVRRVKRALLAILL